MYGYPIVFRCCECTVEEPNLEHLESHIWSRHFQKFPFNCGICDFPAINGGNLVEHFRRSHPNQSLVEFKRHLEDEKLLRKMVAESIAVQVYDEEVANVSHDDDNNVASSNPIVYLSTENADYKSIIDDDPEFGLLEHDDIEEEHSIQYLDEMGNHVYVDAEQSGEQIVNEDCLDSEQRSIIDLATNQSQSHNNYHLKIMRQRRIEKTINDIASEASSSVRIDPGRTAIGPAILRNPIRNSQRNDEKEGNEKDCRFECNLCGKLFKYSSKLNEHKRTHLGERPFECPYCDARFTQNGALKCHIRLHTGERPFECTWECGKTFVSASARRLHEKTHSGERRYVCMVCGRSFTKNSHCERHLRNVHGKDYTCEPSISTSYDYIEATNGAVNEDESIELSITKTTNNIELKPDTQELHNLVNDVIDAVREERMEDQIIISDNG